MKSQKKVMITIAWNMVMRSISLTKTEVSITGQPSLDDIIIDSSTMTMMLKKLTITIMKVNNFMKHLKPIIDAGSIKRLCQKSSVI